MGIRQIVHKLGRDFIRINVSMEINHWMRAPLNQMSISMSHASVLSYLAQYKRGSTLDTVYSGKAGFTSFILQKARSEADYFSRNTILVR